MPKSQAALFLRHLWATDGSVTLARGRRGVASTYGLTSRRLLDDVSRLCSASDLGAHPYRHRWAARAQYTLDISAATTSCASCRRSVHMARSLACGQLLARLDSVKADTNIDTIPLRSGSRSA